MSNNLIVEVERINKSGEYLFDEVEKKNVVMTSMNLLFPKYVIEELKCLSIKEGYCFENALLVAMELKKMGYDDIDVVEGYYKINVKSKKFKRYDCIVCNMEHRFLKKGQYYFDPTYFLDDTTPFSCKDFIYKAERLYDAETLIAYAHYVANKFHNTNEGNCHFSMDCRYCSSLNGFFHDGHYYDYYYDFIGDDCKIVPQYRVEKTRGHTTNIYSFSLAS